MSFGISAVTRTGTLSLQSASATEIRTALNAVRKEGALDISLTRDGRPITEADLGKLTALIVGESTLTRYA